MVKYGKLFVSTKSTDGWAVVDQCIIQDSAQSVNHTTAEGWVVSANRNTYSSFICMSDEISWRGTVCCSHGKEAEFNFAQYGFSNGKASETLECQHCGTVAVAYETYSNADPVVHALRGLGTFFKTDGLMYLTGKAYKPTDPGVVQHLITELRLLMGAPERDDRSDWTFVDLGCGQGAMLPAIRDATTAGQPMFDRVIGVELDEATYRQAVKQVGERSIELVCDDMFAYVENVCAQKQLFGGHAIFYMYEPLWRAGMGKDLRDDLYARLLASVSRHVGAVVVYVTGIDHRHITGDMLIAGGMTLKSSSQVFQSGVANKLSGTSNTMEIWAVEHA